MKRIPTRIYLTGFMGSGKTSVGPVLARKLGYSFLDLDEEIEEVTGTTIPQIFSRQGETVFREIERHALYASAARKDVVIALGGGAIANGNALAFILGSGTCIYLRATKSLLLERLSGDAHRPLLQSSGASLDRQIDDMLDQRKEFYEAAQFSVDVDGKSVVELVDEICLLFDTD